MLGLDAAQNLALNIAEKGFPISVYNRSYDKTQAAVKRAQKEGAYTRLPHCCCCCCCCCTDVWHSCNRHHPDRDSHLTCTSQALPAAC